MVLLRLWYCIGGVPFSVAHCPSRFSRTTLFAAHVALRNTSHPAKRLRAITVVLPSAYWRASLSHRAHGKGTGLSFNSLGPLICLRDPRAFARAVRIVHVPSRHMAMRTWPAFTESLSLAPIVTLRFPTRADQQGRPFCVQRMDEHRTPGPDTFRSVGCGSGSGSSSSMTGTLDSSPCISGPGARRSRGGGGLVPPRPSCAMAVPLLSLYQTVLGWSSSGALVADKAEISEVQMVAANQAHPDLPVAQRVRECVRGIVSLFRPPRRRGHHHLGPRPSVPFVSSASTTDELPAPVASLVSSLPLD